MYLSILLISTAISFPLIAQPLLERHPVQCNENSLGTDSTRLNQPEQVNRATQSRLLARAGGWSGNGGDFGEVNDNIWFIGSKPISYCIKSSPSYQFNRSEIESLIVDSLESWKLFFSKYNLQGNFSANPTPSPRNHSLSFLDGIKRSANFNFQIKETCESADLQFFFGVENKIISEYKKFETEHPYGFAIRKKYDHENFLNSGLVWVKNLKNKAHIEHILLHELGHIFGMKHDSVYIMRSSMAVEMESKPASITQSQIESKAWPYRFVKNSSLDLSPIRPKARRRQKHCTVENSFIAARSYKIYREFLPTKSSDCLSVNIKSLGKDNKKRIVFELSLKNLSTKKRTVVKGFFKSKRKVRGQNNGPGVFTQLQVNSPRRKRLVWKKLFLDRQDSYELSGSFKTGTKSIPAKLIQEKGAILDLYMPASDQWLTLKSSLK